MQRRFILACVWWLFVHFSVSAAALPQGLQLTEAQILQTPATSGTPPQSVRADTLVGPWQRVVLPFAQRHDITKQAAVVAQSQPDAQVVTWYRIQVPPREWGALPLMLYGARAKAYGPIAIYVDGQRIGQRQLDGVDWYWEPLWLTVDNGSRTAAPREILVRMAHQNHTKTALSSLWIGPSEAIRWRYLARDWMQVQVPAMGGGAFLAVGFFAFFVWLLGDRDRVFLLFALLAGASFIRGLHYYTAFSIDNAWLAWLTVNALFWLIAIIHYLQLYLHGTRMPRLSWVINAIVGTVFVLTLPAVGRIPNSPDFTPLVYVLAMLTSPMVAVAGYRLSWGRSSDGMLLASIVAVGTLFGFFDWAIQNNLLGPESWYLGPNVNVINFACFCLLIFRYYMRAVHAARQAHDDLATRLAEREAELRHSYDALREVERTQTLIDERRRLTQDMHDGLGSSLNSALRAVERGRVDGQGVADILRTCIDDLYLAIDAMEPEHADLLLLLATLRHRLNLRLQLAGVTLHWQVGDVPPMTWLDPHASLHILRILQEVLTNSLKHSGANQLWLRTEVLPDAVQVSVRDNGCGYSVEQALLQGGRGMRNQQRRAQAIGAVIDWSSGPQGSHTTLTLPFSSRVPLA